MEARANSATGGAGAGGSAPALPRSARAARACLDLAGATLLAAGLLALAGRDLLSPLRGFDEGVLLTDAMLLLRGKALYRDFYANYPPGIFWTIAGLWRLFGVDPVVARCLGLGIQSGLSLLAGRVAGRAAGRRFSVLAAGLVLAFASTLGCVPFAWLAALLAALVFVERLGDAEAEGRGRWVAAGLALGAVGAFRHDLFVYLALALAALAAAWAARNRKLRPPRAFVRLALPAAAACAAVLAVVFLPVLAQAGFARVAADLFFDQVRYVMPSRLLPLPDLLRLVPALGTRLPALVARPFEGAVALSLAAPFLGAAALLGERRSRGRLDSGTLLTTALSVAVLPQLLGRTDLYHAIYTVAPGLVLAGVLVERGAARVGPSRGRAAVCVAAAALASLPAATSLGARLGRRATAAVPAPSGRYGGLPEVSAQRAEARRELFAFLDARGAAGDPIFVGCADHGFPLMSDMELYFLADRTGATRYMQFDPGVVGRRDVQEEMVRELESVRPKAAVLSRVTLPSEPRRETRAGATLLDEYLATRYRRVGVAGPYLLLERR